MEQEVKEIDDNRINNFFKDINALFKKYEIYPNEIDKHTYLIKLEDGRVGMISADKEEEKEND